MHSSHHMLRTRFHRVRLRLPLPTPHLHPSVVPWETFPETQIPAAAAVAAAVAAVAAVAVQ